MNPSLLEERLSAAERTFATLPGFAAYCNGLPTRLPELARRLASLRTFPMEEAAAGDGHSPSLSGP